MISTSISSTSDYYSSSDLDYDDDHDVVKAAPHHHSHSTKETNIILQTLLQHHHHHHSSSYVSSSIKLQQSLRLLKLVRENDLSDEIFIRANTILHKFLVSTHTNDVDDSILIACLSLSTKLSEHSNHFIITLFNSSSLSMYENMICDAVDWDIDMMTPINYVEAMLLDMNDYLVKDRLRKLSYEMIVLCLTDIVCMNVSVVSMGISCLLMACELLDCGEVVGKQVFKCKEDKDTLFQLPSICIRQVVMNIFGR